MSSSSDTPDEYKIAVALSQDDSDLEKLLADYPSLLKYRNYLNSNAAKKYGIRGVYRFYSGLIGVLAPELIIRHGTVKPHGLKYKIKKAIGLLSPLNSSTAVYNKLGNYTKSDSILNGVRVSSLLAHFMAYFLPALFFIPAQLMAGNGEQTLTETLLSQTGLYMFSSIALSGFLMGSLANYVVKKVSFWKRNKVSISEEEISEDLASYSVELNRIVNDYKIRFSNDKETAVTLEEFVGLYKMLSFPISMKTEWDIAETRGQEEKTLASIKNVLKKVPNRKSIKYSFSNSPNDVGSAFWFRPFLGRLHKRKIVGKTTININDVGSNLEYSLYLGHEFSHLAGAASEPIAEFYAKKILEDLSENYPHEGYDMLRATERLCDVINAFYYLVRDPKKLRKSLKKAGVPLFILEAFDNDYNSIPIQFYTSEEDIYNPDLLYKSFVYYVSKREERGELKLKRGIYR